MGDVRGLMNWDRPTIIMAAMFIFVSLTAIAITPVFVDEGMQAFENEESLLNPLWYMVLIVFMALGILFLIKKGFKNIIRGVIYFVFFMAISYVIYPFTAAYLEGDTSEEWREMDFGDDVVAIEVYDPDGKGTDLVAVEHSNGTTIINGRHGPPEVLLNFSNIDTVLLSTGVDMLHRELNEGGSAHLSGHTILAHDENVTSISGNQLSIVAVSSIPNASVYTYGTGDSDLALMAVNGTLWTVDASLTVDRITRYENDIRHVEASDMWGDDRLEIIVLEGDKVHILHGKGHDRDWVISDILGDLDAVDADVGEWDGDEDTIEMFVVADGKVYMVKIFTGEYDLWALMATSGMVASFIAMALAVALTGLLWYYPEWYVLDVLGVIIAAGLASLIGISFAPLPAIILLMGLIIYDAIAVYQSKHMIDLADEAVSQHLPLLVVIPKEKGYSYRDQGSIKKQIDAGEEREAMFLGLGDLIIPTVLVVSAFRFLDAEVAFGPIGGNLAVALGTMVGILSGFIVLSIQVASGKPQAGLPFLNTGALVGFFVSGTIVYGGLGFL
jgi:presenilin-like A22 family membrane protease